MNHRAGWITLTVTVGNAHDAVAAALFEAGAEGLHESGDRIVTHARSGAVADALVCAALAVDASVRVETAPLADIDWSEEWKRGIDVQGVGTITIAPPWLAEGLDPARTVIIDPGMAFGTGDHPTTRGVIRLLQAVIRQGDAVADLGAGSAVLSIVAAKLGATRVAAIELDHDAIGNAEENVARNGVGRCVHVIDGDAVTLLPLVAPVRVISANILSSILVELLPVMSAALTDDGVAVLGGVLRSERQDFVEFLRKTGWRVVAEDCEDVWWSASIER